MGKERDFGKEIDALQKQISDLRKANRKTKRHESVKCLLSNWFLWIIVLFFILGITMFLKFYPITDDKQVSVVLAFVGIASTFVVISNYAQVQDIKKEFDSKIENITNLHAQISREITEALSDIANVRAGLHLLYAKTSEKDGIVNAFAGYLDAMAYGLIIANTKDGKEVISECISSIERLNRECNESFAIDGSNFIFVENVTDYTKRCVINIRNMPLANFIRSIQMHENYNIIKNTFEGMLSKMTRSKS